MVNNSFNYCELDELSFFEDIIKFIPRLLSLLDRNPCSPTYGCFDRNYWHYKTLIDFSSATYQYGTLILALLYDNKFTGNIYYKNPDILEYTKAGMFFWAKIQNRDGSFDEWYLNEHSYVATAFTTYAVSESLLILKDKCEFSKDENEEIVKAINKSASWLSKNIDKFTLNHIAGATIALYNAYLINGNKSIKDMVQNNLNIILEKQNNEGWFSEYNGADIGYLTVSIDFLAKYYQKTKDAIAKKILSKALDFLVYFIHPDGSIGGEYGSRNTKYIFLHGLKILSGEFDSARYILKMLYKNTQFHPVPNILYSADDRYFIFFFLGNLLQASLEHETKSDSSNLDLCRFSKVFSESGLVTVKTSNYHIICNSKKGGVIKVFSVDNESQLIYSDVGYFGRLINDTIISTQWLAPKAFVKIRENTSQGLIIEINQQFSYVNYKLPLTSMLIPFRIFNYTLGYSNTVVSFFNNFLKRNFIMRNKRVPIFLNRKIEIKDDLVIICDEVVRKCNLTFRNLNILKNATTMHVPTSRYFMGTDMSDKTLRELDFSKIINGVRSFRLVVVLKFVDHYPELSIKLNGTPL